MRTKRTVGALLALLVLSVGLVACGSDDGDKATAEENEVYAKDLAFSPATLKVDAGATVTFENQDGTAHTFTADDGSFDAGTVQPDEEATHTFDEAGSFSYHCEIHPSMKGTIDVE